MKKDLEYAAKEAERQGARLGTGEAALRAFEHAMTEGLGQQDMSAVVEDLRASQ